MLLLLLVSFALADYPATPAFPLTTSVIQSALINGSYVCPPYTTCYSHTGTPYSCEKGSVCCSSNQVYSNDTCIDQVPLATCGLQGNCCSFTGICTVDSTCCSMGDYCTNIQNSTATCVTQSMPTGVCSGPNCGTTYPTSYTPYCEDCGYYGYYNPDYSLLFLAIFVLIFGCLSFIVVLVNSTIKVFQISRILRKFTPEVISEIVRIHPTYFDGAMKDLTIRGDFHDNLATLRNHFSYSRFYQPVVFLTSFGYFLDQILRYSSPGSQFAAVTFSIFILCIALWAGRSIYLRFKLKMYFVAIPKLDKARKELLKTVVVEANGKNPNPPAYDEGSGQFLTL